jgi:hypothetical protein
MLRIGVCSIFIVWLASTALAFDEPAEMRERFLNQMKAELARLPDYVCRQTVDRFSRTAPEEPLNRIDTVALDVAMVGDHEVYSLAGARRFESRPLAQITGKGSITTGQLGLFATNVFLNPSAQFTYKGETEQDGRPAHEYSYDVAATNSSYRLRSGMAESIVAFQGSFWIDAKTLDLIRLEVQAYDIPEKLGLAEVNSALLYSRPNGDGKEVLLPLAATFSAIGSNGEENLNRSTLSACRHYSSESAVRQHAEGVAERAGASGVATSEAPADPLKGSVVELVLEAILDPGAATVGDPVRATIARPVTSGERILIPQGATVLGRLVRLDKTDMPFLIYDIGLQFDTVEVAGRALPFAATMIDAGPASGLLRQEKKLDPKFSTQRTAKIEVLVREVQRGQGILSWDARHGAIPKGLRMKWRIGVSLDKNP